MSVILFKKISFLNIHRDKIILTKLYAPLNFLGTYYRIIQNAFTDTENLLELLGEKPEPLEPENPVSLSNAAVSLGLDRVSFKYQSDQERQILAEVDFYIPSGQTWALVGESGSGKSTISRFLSCKKLKFQQ